MSVFTEYLNAVIECYHINGGNKNRLMAAIELCRYKDALTAEETLQMQEAGLPIIQAISEIESIKTTYVIDYIRQGKIRYSFGDLATLIWHMACQAQRH